MPAPKQASPSSAMPTDGDDCASRSKTTASVFPSACTAGFPSRLPFRFDRRQPRNRAGLYPEYRPPDRSPAPPRQPAGTRQPFYPDIHSQPKTPFPEDSPIPPVLFLFRRRHNACRTILDGQPIYRRPESLRQRRTPEPRRSHLQKQ